MNMWTYIIGVPIFCGYQVGQSALVLELSVVCCYSCVFLLLFRQLGLIFIFCY